MTAAAAVSPAPVKSTPAPKTTTPSSLLTDQAQDIPIFLRKTYHMVDTCDPAIASWSDDGETFVVKDPVKFEQQIIPQFFKHSKFSSFVRQLNFYAFRKIKYADTIRIDPKLEAETANYWRFRHEKFQRGKPELLAEIKRMNGQKQQQKQQKQNATQERALAEKENTALKSEVTSLKQRIEAMTKNIDELTSLVQKVSLQQQQQQQQQQTPAPKETINSNNKRTKIVEEEVKPLPDATISATPSPTPAVTSMELDDLPLPPSIPSPMPVDRTSTSTSELSDDGFVDQLFTAFKTEDFEFDEAESLPPSEETSTRPRPELMNRLSEALSLLPRDIQELIVDRLIQSIMSPKDIQDNISAVNALKEVAKPSNKAKSTPLRATGENKPVNLGLAAATLAALLSQCGGELKGKDSTKDATKTLLIPVHA